MTFSIDQFASIAPETSPSPRPQVDNTTRRDENSRRDDYQDRDIASRRTYEDRTPASTDDNHSNFQKHLNDEVNDRAAQDDRAAHRAESHNDSDTTSKRPQDTHGNTVSQVAVTAEGPNETEPSDATTKAHAAPVAHPDKGMIVKAAAVNKSEPVIEAGEVISGQANPADAEAVASLSSPDLTSAQGDPNGEQPAVSGQDKAAAAPAPVGTAPTPPQPASAETTAPDGDDPVPGKTDHAGPLDGASDASSETPTPHYNENAQKVEASERPGWGAEHAPRSERGTQAREANPKNVDKTSSSESETAAKGAFGTTPPTDIKSDPAEAATSTATLDPAAAPDTETDITGAIAPDQIVNTAEAKPNLEAPTIVATTVSGDGSPSKSESRDAKGGSAASDKLAAASNVPGSTDKSAPSQPATNRNTDPSAPVDPQAGTTAKASPDASPTGVAQALASGQGKMPMTGAPSAEAVGLAQSGTDKRGTRTGVKGNDTPGGAAGVAKAGKAKAEGNPQSPFDPGQHKSKSSPAHQAAQPQASTAATNAQAASQSAQGTAVPAPVMPDLAALTTNADMSLSRGNATMEVDPVTGALHLSGTGSAKMSAPNLSEVTLQFSRARMVQTPAKDIAVQIAKHLSDGVNRFEIRITPPELGRIEVKLEIAESGRISAHLVADKPETLDLLQKDRATLEKALAEAGLDADESSLEFSMREGKGDKNPDFKSLGMEVADKASDGQNASHIENLAELEISAYGFDIVRMKRLDISI